MNNSSNKKGILTLGLISFLTDTASEMITPILPIFLTTILGINIIFLGMIEGVAKSITSLIKIFSGWFSDYIGKRKIFLYLGYGLSAIFRPFLAFVTHPWSILSLRFLDFLGKGLRDSPRDALIADLSSKETYGWSFGYHKMMDVLGSVTGPLLCAFLLYLLIDYGPDKYRLVFLLTLIPAFLALLLLATVKEPKREKKQEEIFFSLRLIKKFSLEFKIFLLIYFLFMLANFSEVFFILKAKEVGIGIETLPILYGLIGLSYACLTLPIGILSDRIGRRLLLIIGWLIFTLVYIGFAQTTSSWQVWFLFIGYGIYYGLTMGVSRAFVADMVAPELRGTAYGFYNMANGLAVLPASIIAGILWSQVNSDSPFYFGAILGALATILLIIFRRTRVKYKYYARLS